MISHSLYHQPEMNGGLWGVLIGEEVVVQRMYYDFFFCYSNHDETGNAVGIYSLMGCCKVTGVDFKKKVLHFLSYIHEYSNDYTRNLAELLPHNLKKLGLL